MDKLAIGLIGILTAGFIASVFFTSLHDHQAKLQAQSMDCTYIGSARDMGSIGFFECGDKIVLKRIK